MRTGERGQGRSEWRSLHAVGGADLLWRTGREARSAHLRGSPQADPALGIGWATVITRALRYPPGWPAAPAQEKGVDVALAVDFVKLGIEGEYDMGVMMSTDNDLLPALEVVRTNGCSSPASGATN